MSKLYDYYFSAKHKRTLIASGGQRSGSKYSPSYFKGREYTEAIEHGRTPVTNHEGDLVLLGTGTDADVTWSKPKEQKSKPL